MAETFEEAVREAKMAAGLDPDAPALPSQFHMHIEDEWRGQFWHHLIARNIARSAEHYAAPPPEDE